MCFLKLAGMDLPKGLEAHDLQNLIHLLESTEDPTIQEQALITLSNSAAFSKNHVRSETMNKEV